MYIFTYTNYKTFFNDYCDQEKSARRGIKGALAQAMGCQASYLSQVLKGSTHLNLEHAMGAADFMGLTDAETEYLLLLVEYARAGSHKLANFLEAKIRKQQKDKTTLKERFADAKAIPINDQHEYYSAWYYSAIHILLAIPGFSDPTKIAHRLHLPIEIVHRVIEYLLRIGLVVRGRDGFEFTENRLYLDRDSVFIQRHHINWRSQSLQAVEKNLPSDLHYSNVMAISKDDFERVRETLTKAVADTRKIIGPSPEEGLYAMTLDLFAL